MRQKYTPLAGDCAPGRWPPRGIDGRPPPAARLPEKTALAIHTVPKSVPATYSALPSPIVDNFGPSQPAVRNVPNNSTTAGPVRRRDVPEPPIPVCRYWEKIHDSVHTLWITRSAGTIPGPPRSVRQGAVIVILAAVRGPWAAVPDAKPIVPCITRLISRSRTGDVGITGRRRSRCSRCGAWGRPAPPRGCGACRRGGNGEP